MARKTILEIIESEKMSFKKPVDSKSSKKTKTETLKLSEKEKKNIVNKFNSMKGAKKPTPTSYLI